MWRPRNQTSVTALFKNTQILKFKSRLTFPFFAAVNHLSGPLRKQKFPSTGFWKVMVCDLWLADFDPFCAFLCFKVRCSVHDRNDNWWRWKTHLLGRRLNFRVRVFFNYTYIHIPANAQDSTLFHYSVLLYLNLMVNAEHTVVFHMHGPLPPVFFCRSKKRACAHKASSHQEQPNRHQRSRKEQLHRAIYYKIKSDYLTAFLSAHA